MRKIISLNETLRLYIDYVDIETGEPTDPTSLVCVIRNPLGTSTTITYPDPDFVQVSSGSYFVRIVGAVEGTYRYTITAQVSIDDIDIRDGKFDVESLV